MSSQEQSPLMGNLSLALSLLLMFFVIGLSSSGGPRLLAEAQALPIKLTGDLAVYGSPENVKVSQNGEWMVFTTSVYTPTYHVEAYSARVDGGDGPNLLFASLTNGVGYLSISPDSQHVIAYTNSQLVSVPIAGGPNVVLSTSSGSGYFADGGASVVYVESRLTGGFDSYVYRLVRSPVDHAQPTYLTPEMPGIGISQPAGVGGTFYYQLEAGGARSFWVLPTGSDISLPVTGIDSSYDITSVVADPTGQYVFVVAQTTGYPVMPHYFGVSLSNHVASEITALPVGQNLNSYSLRFTPDGQQVVFLTCRPSLAACSSVMSAPAAGGAATLIRAAVGAEGFSTPIQVTAQSSYVVLQTLDVMSLRHRLISLRLSDGHLAELASDVDHPDFTLEAGYDLWLSGDGYHVVFDLVRTAGYLEGALYSTGLDGGIQQLLEDAEDPIVGGRACITANSQQVVFRDTNPPDTSGGPPDDLGGYLYHLPIWGGSPQPVLAGNPLVGKYFVCPMGGVVIYSSGSSLYTADLGAIATPQPTNTELPSPTATVTPTPSVAEQKVFLPTVIH